MKTKGLAKNLPKIRKCMKISMPESAILNLYVIFGLAISNQVKVFYIIDLPKICIIETYNLKYFFEYINDAIICRQTIFNQLSIMVPYVDMIGLCHYLVLNERLIQIYF